MSSLPDSFALAPEAAAIAADLIAACEEFSHLSDARLAFVASQRTPVLRGSPCLAFVCPPYVQGPLHFLYAWLLEGFVPFEFEAPDYVVILDAALWPSWDAEQRERVVYHELCHIVAVIDEDTGLEKRGDDGRIRLRLQPHTYELFSNEVLRYGPVALGVSDLAVELAEGHRRAQRRRIHVA